MTITIFHYRDFLKDFLAKELVPGSGHKDWWDISFGLCHYFGTWLRQRGEDQPDDSYKYIGARLIANGYTLIEDDGEVTYPAYPFGMDGGYGNPTRMAFAEKEYEWAKEMANYCKWLQKWEANPPSDMGLCNGLGSNLGRCAEEYSAYLGYRITVRRRMMEKFDNCSHPFGGEARYQRDHILGRMHLNPDRIAFVRSELEEFGL